ncbi:hypothetical protein B566_EDAN015313 [Ephemera danica]|nr:hypothetical protein B566_EDAN015313 [Ephemera danica]
MVKEKPNSTRIYDEDGYRRRAACICVRNEAENERKRGNVGADRLISVTSGNRQRKWFGIDEALDQLSRHKPVQLTYLQSLITCKTDSKVT